MLGLSLHEATKGRPNLLMGGSGGGTVKSLARHKCVILWNACEALKQLCKI